MRQHATEAIEDGLSHPMLTRLVEIGEGQNSNSGIMSLLEACEVATLIEQADLGGKATHIVRRSSYIRAIARHYPHEFKLRLGACLNKVRRFWEGLLSRPRGRQMALQHKHLRNKTVDDLATTIPMVVFEDAGPMLHNKTGTGHQKTNGVKLVNATLR